MSNENLPSITEQELEQRANAYADEMERSVSGDSLSFEFYKTSEDLRAARKSIFSEMLRQHYSVREQADPFTP